MITFLITAAIIVAVRLVGFAIASVFNWEDNRTACYVYAGTVGVLVGLLVDRW